MILDDQHVCVLCGMDFPLTPEGAGIFAAHILAEAAVSEGCATVKRPSERAMTQLSFDEVSKTGREAPADEETF